MSRLVTLLETTKVTAYPDWGQDLNQLEDLSDGIEAGIVMLISQFSNASGNTVIGLRAAIDKHDQHFANYVTLATIGTSLTTPAVYYVYLAGPGTGGSGTPGFPPYLRVFVAQDNGDSVTLEVKAILKP